MRKKTTIYSSRKQAYVESEQMIHMVGRPQKTDSHGKSGKGFMHAKLS